MKRAKSQIILYSIVVALNAICAIGYLLMKRYILGSIWGIATILWSISLYFSIKEYRFLKREKTSLIFW